MEVIIMKVEHLKLEKNKAEELIKEYALDEIYDPVNEKNFNGFIQNTTPDKKIISEIEDLLYCFRHDNKLYSYILRLLKQSHSYLLMNAIEETNQTEIERRLFAYTLYGKNVENLLQSESFNVEQVIFLSNYMKIYPTKYLLEDINNLVYKNISKEIRNNIAKETQYFSPIKEEIEKIKKDTEFKNIQLDITCYYNNKKISKFKSLHTGISKMILEDIENILEYCGDSNVNPKNSNEFIKNDSNKYLSNFSSLLIKNYSPKIKGMFVYLFWFFSGYFKQEEEYETKLKKLRSINRISTQSIVEILVNHHSRIKHMI